MTNMSKTIIFFGTDTFSAVALRYLIEADYEIGAVITKPDSKSGRGQKLVAPAVKQIAQEHGIPVWQPTKLTEVTDNIIALGNVVGVLSSYGRIIPQSVIDLFRPGIINIHPSLLPRYRGPSPIETAIINGDSETGVSIMKLSADMDAGPIYAQEVYDLNGTETAPELYQSLSALGGRMLIETLPSIIDGNLLPSPQTNAAIYCYLLKKEDALLKPDDITATEAERRVRAYLIFPKTKLVMSTKDKDATIIVTKAHIVNSATNDKDLIVAFKDDSYLAIDELIAPNGRTMSGLAFKNGYQRNYPT